MIHTFLQKAESKVIASLEGQQSGFPNYSKGRQWCYSPVSGWENTYGDWTAGFWPGILWALYDANGEPCYRDQASLMTGLLESRLSYDSHDLGFLFYPSCVQGYILTGEDRFRSWALQAADGLMTLFSQSTGLIEIRRSFASDVITAIDTMMNLPLLWWAYQETGREDYGNVALAHARATARHFIRSDGSTWHILRWSRGNGEVLSKETWQGWKNDSCWSRGQAWALAGFIWARIFSGKDEFDTEIARLFDYIKISLPGDMIPYWDYHVGQSETDPKDSSAAAIMCSGLLHCSVSCPSGDLTEKLKETGLKILHSLMTSYSLSPDDPEPGLLGHGCYHAPNQFATDACLIFGDYYYLDSLLTARSLIH